DSAAMDQKSKAIQQRKEQRVVRRRRVNPPSNDQLTPTDLLKLIPSPIVLSDRSLAGYARRLEQRRERLQRLTARFAGKEFGRYLGRFIFRNSPGSRRWRKKSRRFRPGVECLTRKEFGIYMDALRQMRGAIAGLMREVQNAGHRADENRYLL